MTYLAHAALYSGLHWIGMGLGLLVLLLLGAAPWTGELGFRAAARAGWEAGLRAWPLLAYAAALTALGSAALPAGRPGWVAAVPAAAALTWAAIWWLAGPRPSTRTACSRALAPSSRPAWWRSCWPAAGRTWRPAWRARARCS